MQLLCTTPNFAANSTKKKPFKEDTHQTGDTTKQKQNTLFFVSVCNDKFGRNPFAGISDKCQALLV